MRLSFYFFRQFLPSFFFGATLFTFIFLLDKLFNLIDLILNKGIHIIMVVKLFALFIPTAFPLALPMAILLASMVTFGRLSEENQLIAVRAAGLSLTKILAIFPIFALLISILLIPFNTNMAPWINKAFRVMYEEIVQSDPLINIQAKRFFELKNIKIYANGLEKDKNILKDLFVYQIPSNDDPPERIFAREGIVEADDEKFTLLLKTGQLQRFNRLDPLNLLHATFDSYKITVPLKGEKSSDTTRFRNVSSRNLKSYIMENKSKGLKTNAMEAEYHLRHALAFAPLCLAFIGIPLAISMKKGGKAFNMGISLVVIFSYYLFLILGLTIAEKGIVPAFISLWLANIICLSIGTFLGWRIHQQ